MRAVRYGVLSCPDCRRVQMVELRFRSVRCTGCSRLLPLEGARFFYQGEGEAEARAALWRTSAQLAGMGIEEYARLLERLEEEQVGRVEDVLGALASRGEFTLEAWVDEMRRLRVPGEPGRALERLVAENRVYEPRTGRYRVI